MLDKATINVIRSLNVLVMVTSASILAEKNATVTKSSINFKRVPHLNEQGRIRGYSSRVWVGKDCNWGHYSIEQEPWGAQAEGPRPLRKKWTVANRPTGQPNDRPTAKTGHDKSTFSIRSFKWEENPLLCSFNSSTPPKLRLLLASKIALQHFGNHKT